MHFYAEAIFQEETGLPFLFYLRSKDKIQAQIIEIPYEQMGKIERSKILRRCLLDK